MELAWLPPHVRSLKHVAGSLVVCDDPTVSLVATKRADAGCGVVIRLSSAVSDGRLVHLWFPNDTVRIASLCDACERDLGPLEVREGRALVPISTRLTSVRLVVGGDARSAAE
jgi:hypothetical protein